MILYCDTSALIKLYVEEAHSDAVAKTIAGIVLSPPRCWPIQKPVLHSPEPDETGVYAL